MAGGRSWPIATNGDQNDHSHHWLSIAGFSSMQILLRASNRHANILTASASISDRGE
jgi:hypothetical protein